MKAFQFLVFLLLALPVLAQVGQAPSPRGKLPVFEAEPRHFPRPANASSSPRIVAPPLPAGAVRVFGPQDFVWQEGQPNSETVNFTVQNPNLRFLLRVVNGGLQNQFARVASADTRVDSEYIFGPDDINQNIPLIELPVRLSAGNGGVNTLTVDLMDGPGSGFNLEIIGFLATGNCPLTVQPGHAALCVAKDASNNPVLTWNSTAPPDITVTLATNGAFTMGVETFLQSTAPPSQLVDLTHAAQSKVFYDLADNAQGEVSSAVQGIGYIPPFPPYINSVSPTGLFVGDVLVINGLNYDKITSANQVFINQIVQPILLTATDNSDTRLSVTIAKGSVGGKITVCSHGICGGSSQTYDVDILLARAATPGGANYTGIAFDDARDSNAAAGMKLWASEAISNQIRRFDPDIGRPPSEINASVTNPVISTMSFKNGTLAYSSNDGSDINLHALDRFGVVSLIGPMSNGNAAACHGVAPSAAAKPIGISVDPTSSTIGNVFLCDANSGFVRFVSSASGPIDASYGGLNLAPVTFPCPLIVLPGGAFTEEFYAYRYWFQVSSSTCTGTNYQYFGDYGPTVTGATLNEVNKALWVCHSPCVIAFGQERSTHYSMYLDAYGDTLYRDIDPEISILPKYPTRVLISKQVAADTYPSPQQTADRQLKFDINASLTGAELFVRLIDPGDSSGYAPATKCAPFTGGRVCDDTTTAGQKCDNRSWCDASTTPDDFRILSTAQCPVTFPTGATDFKGGKILTNSIGNGCVEIQTTGRYAGDNYQLQASYQNFVTSSDAINFPNFNPNAHIKVQSGVITAWKRIYTERDHMFRRGGLLFADATAGQNSVRVYDWGSGANQNSFPSCPSTPGASPCYQIAVFDTATPYESTQDRPYVGYVTSIVSRLLICIWSIRT